MMQAEYLNKYIIFISWSKEVPCQVTYTTDPGFSGKRLRWYLLKIWSFDFIFVTLIVLTPITTFITTSKSPNMLCGSCYGASSGCCNTCSDVRNAYRANKWNFNSSLVYQCTTINIGNKSTHPFLFCFS